MTVDIEKTTVFTTHLTHTQITTQGHSITVQNNTTATSTEGKVVNKIQSTVTSVFNLTLLRRYMTETFPKRRKINQSFHYYVLKMVLFGSIHSSNGM